MRLYRHQNTALICMTEAIPSSEKSVHACNFSSSSRKKRLQGNYPWASFSSFTRILVCLLLFGESRSPIRNRVFSTTFPRSPLGCTVLFSSLSPLLTSRISSSALLRALCVLTHAFSYFFHHHVSFLCLAPLLANSAPSWKGVRGQ